MSKELTFEELSEEYRQASMPHPIRQDFYKALKNLVAKYEQSFEDARASWWSEKYDFDKSREDYITVKRTAVMVIDQRFDMMIRLRSRAMIDTVLTPEERKALEEIDAIRERMKGMVK